VTRSDSSDPPEIATERIILESETIHELRSISVQETDDLPRVIEDTGAPTLSELKPRFGAYALLGHLRGVRVETHFAQQVEGEERKTVWLKRLAADALAVPELAEAFVRAQDTIARASHPNFVRLIDSGDIDGWPYVVFDHVDARSLDELFGKQRLAIGPGLELIERITGVLMHLHALRDADGGRIAHGELTPRSVQITRWGGVRVLDFGFDRLERLETGATLSTADTADYHYIAPETVAGQPPTPARDIYALGVLAAEILLGGSRLSQTATESSSSSEFARTVRERLFAFALPRELIDLIAMMLADAPKARPPADRVRQDLLAIRRQLGEVDTLEDKLGAMLSQLGQLDEATAKGTDPSSGYQVPLVVPAADSEPAQPASPKEAPNETLIPATLIRASVLQEPRDDEVTAPEMPQPGRISPSEETVRLGEDQAPTTTKPRPQNRRLIYAALAAILLALAVVLAALLVSPP
jgi:serine/threonine protein kinase